MRPPQPTCSTGEDDEVASCRHALSPPLRSPEDCRPKVVGGTSALSVETRIAVVCEAFGDFSPVLF